MVFPEGAKDLVLKLLRRNAEKRYGAKGVSEIKHHKFFKDINFRKLSKHQVEPPWKPKKLAINAENQVDLDDKNAEVSELMYAYLYMCCLTRLTPANQ